jgi:hypothetical protein
MMTKGSTSVRCSPVSLVVLIAVCVLLVGAVSVQAASGSSPVTASSNSVSAAVRSVQPAIHGLMQIPMGRSLKRIQKSTPSGDGIGTFSLDAGLADACVGEVAGFHNPSCTSNDVTLTAIEEGSLVVYGNCTVSNALCTTDAGCPAGETCDGKGCTGAANDFITFSATGIFDAGEAERYDLGVYISTDNEGADGDGAEFGHCVRWAFSTAETGADLDGDTCGDLNGGSDPHLDFGPVTVPCVDADGDGLVDVWHCETWANNPDQIPDQNTDCTGTVDVQPGTGAKCNCGLLPGTCIPFPDENECTLDVCLGTCSTTTTTTCADNTECPSGETCEGIHLQHIDNSDACDDSDACTTDACDPDTGCTNTAITCDDSDACTTDTCDPATGCVYTPNPACNDSNACTTDTCNPATGCVYTPNPACDDGNACTIDTCDPASGCVYTPTTCDEGCTPGFWKQEQHFDEWVGYSPTDLVSSVFTVPAPCSSLGTKTLLEALNFGGKGQCGAQQTLLRAAVSALLNSTSVNYPLSTQEVIDQVNAALASGDRKTILALAKQLDTYNNLGAPICQ